MKRFWVAVLGIGMLGVSAEADLTRFPLCTAGGVQDYPAIDGPIVVWQDERSGMLNQDIYGFHFSESHELVICTAPQEQSAPSVSGPIVVWQDMRSGNYDIWGFDLRTHQEFAICTNIAAQRNPRLSGSIVIWQDYRAGNWDVYGYNLETGTEFVISNGAAFEGYPVIDGPWVVWVDLRNGGNWDLYAKNLQTWQETAVCTQSAAQFYPSVSGEVVVWQDERNKDTTGVNVYARRLPDGPEFVVCEAVGDQILPVIQGSMIVWEDYRNGTANSDIYACNLATEAFLVVDTRPGHQLRPTVWGNRIVWRSGDDLFYADVPVPTVLTLLSPNGGEMFLAGTETSIHWQTEGASPDYIQIVYSADNGITWNLITPGVPNTGLYLWRPLPDLDSSACFIRISDSADPLKTDITDAAFTIFRCERSLTADLDGDCFVGLSDFSLMASQWLRCGNPYDPQWCLEQ